jgi:hypothetical protein
MHSQAEIGEDGYQHFAAAYGGRARDLKERLTSRMRDNSDSLSYRPYITEGEEELMRNIEIRSHVRLYRQHDPDLPRSNYLVGRS